MALVSEMEWSPAEWNESTSQFYAQEADKIFAKVQESKRQILQSHLLCLNGHFNGNVPDTHFLETAQNFTLELVEVKLLFQKMNYVPAAISKMISQVVPVLSGDFLDAQASGFTEDIRQLIDKASESEKGLETAAQSYGRVLLETFGQEKEWSKNAPFQHFKSQVLKRKINDYFKERSTKGFICGLIKNTETLLELLSKTKTQILDTYGQEHGADLYKTREALRKWLVHEESRFLKKATESLVSTL